MWFTEVPDLSLSYILETSLTFYDWVILPIPILYYHDLNKYKSPKKGSCAKNELLSQRVTEKRNKEEKILM